MADIGDLTSPPSKRTLGYCVGLTEYETKNRCSTIAKFFLFRVENFNTITHEISNTLAHRSFLNDRIATKDRMLNYIILGQLSHTIIKKKKQFVMRAGFCSLRLCRQTNSSTSIPLSSAAVFHGISVRILPTSIFTQFTRRSRESSQWHHTDRIILDNCPN